jgi:hypothetical protein
MDQLKAYGIDPVATNKGENNVSQFAGAPVEDDVPKS